MKYYVLVVEYCEASYDGPFDTPKERDEAAVTIRTDPAFSEDGMVFKLNIDRDGKPAFGMFTGGDFE